MNDSPQYVTCHCQHCDGGIEFDASDFEKGESRAVECPHCLVETIICVPNQERKQAVNSKKEDTKGSVHLVPYIGFKCEICDQIIEAWNVRRSESIICPHCKCTQFIPRENLEFGEGAKMQSDPGIACARQEDAIETPECLQQAAELGNADAENNLGVCYERGRGVAKDEAEAVKWYRKAAEQNYALAQYNLGVCYATGQGVAKDEAEAVKWYRKAAEQNYLLAQSELDAMYDTGRGVPQDDVAAVEWLGKCAEQGCAASQTLLGMFYVNGHGVPKDLVQGHVWLSLGAANGDEVEAPEALAQLENYMTAEQKVEAARLASELFKRFKSPGWMRELFETFKRQGTLAIGS